MTKELIKIEKLKEEGYHIRFSGAGITMNGLTCDSCGDTSHSLTGIEDGKDIKNDKWICVNCLLKLHPKAL